MPAPRKAVPSPEATSLCPWLTEISGDQAGRNLWVNGPLSRSLPPSPFFTGNGQPTPCRNSPIHRQQLYLLESSPFSESKSFSVVSASILILCLRTGENAHCMALEQPSQAEATIVSLESPPGQPSPDCT